MSLDDATAPSCTVCGRGLWDTELAAGRIACYRCEDIATEKLQAIPALYAQLCTLDALMKGTSPGGRGGSGYRVPPAPVVMPVLNETAEGGVVAQLQAIEDSWRRALGWSMGAKRRYDDVQAAVKFVVNNLPWACGAYPEVADDLAAIRELHGHLHNLATGEKGERRFTAYCDRPNCTGGMRIRLSTPRAFCPECGYEHDRESLTSLDTEFGPNPSRERTAA